MAGNNLGSYSGGVQFQSQKLTILIEIIMDFLSIFSEILA